MRTLQAPDANVQQTPGAAPDDATPGRLLVSIVATGLGVLALAAAGQWAGDAWLSAILAAMAASVLLGVLLVRKPGVSLVIAYALVALASAAGGAMLAGASPVPALFPAAASVAGALIGHAALRWKRVDPAGLHELAAFARTAAVAVIVLPACQLLADLAFSGDVAEPWPMWIAGALGALAMLPLVLAWPRAEAPGDSFDRGRLVLAVATWLPLPVMLWWQPGMLVLAWLPMVALATRLGPLAIATLGLPTGFVIAAWAVSADGSVGPADVALPACAMLLAALSIAILARQRARTEHVLAASQEHLRAVTENSPALVAILDADGRHRFANRSYLQWLGQDSSQVLGRSLLQVYGEAAILMTAFRRAIGGQPQRQLIELPDGRILDAQLEPRFSAEGPVDGVHLLAQDASWRSAHERAIDALLAGAMDPTLLLDAAGVIARIDPKAEALLGAASNALRGRPLSAWLEPSAAEVVAEALGHVCENRQPQRLPRNLDLHARRADGDTFPLELQLAPMETARGLQVVVVMQDIRPRLAWEELMVSTRNQAEITLDAIGDAVVACDLHRHITVFNPAAAKMSGWSEQEALGRPLDDVLRFVDAATGAHVPSLLVDAIARNTTVRKHDDKLLMGRDGKSAAVAESAAPMRDQFGQTSGGVVLLHDVSHSRAQAQTLTHQAQHDHLTGLPNRVLLHDRLSQALAQMDRGYKGALLYLDLDRFKPINDRLGHPVGDRVLQEVATRLRGCVREDDTVSRQGGDEFVLLLVRLADPRDAARVAGKLIDSIERPISIDGHELSVSASIGIALFPQDGRDTGALTKNADAALYHAKAGGRGRYSYFTDIMSASAEERMRTEHDLRIALSNGDFVLEWQPQVHLPGQRISGVEALVRWRQYDGSVLLPEQFLQVAEETGLLVQIDEWVLREACHQNRRWQMAWQSRGLAPMPVSVNVSLARFDAERLLAHVRAVLLDSALAPQWLEIEFRGAQLFAQGAHGQALVSALKALGVRVAVDDFGTGQTSLGALAEFTFDTLKIDRGFIDRIDEDPRSRAVIKAVLGIGKAMGVRVVAKGIETHAQLDALVQLGCTGMQGLMFGEPASHEQFANLVARGAVAQVPEKTAAVAGTTRRGV